MTEARTRSARDSRWPSPTESCGAFHPSRSCRRVVRRCLFCVRRPPSRRGTGCCGHSERTALRARCRGRSLLRIRPHVHCGVEWARLDGACWRTTPLDDGNRNPPVGWGNPYDAGEMTMIDEGRAEYAGPDGATPFARTESVDGPLPCACERNSSACWRVIHSDGCDFSPTSDPGGPG
jgi:hypothetical protein